MRGCREHVFHCHGDTGHAPAKSAAECASVSHTIRHRSRQNFSNHSDASATLVVLARLSKLADALVRINETRSLESEEDRAHLITLIGLTALRNPEMRRNIRKIHQDVGRMNIAARLRSQETYDASVQEAKQQGALPADYDVTYDEMKTAFDGGDFRLVLTNNAFVSLEPQLLDHTMPLLFRRGWHLLRAPEGSGGFITSDRPFFLM
jgi:hypothetical protein